MIGPSAGPEIGLGPAAEEGCRNVLQALNTQIEASWMALLDANYVPAPPIVYDHGGPPYQLTAEAGHICVSINPGWFTDAR